MATDLTLIIEDRPGTLADIGSVMGKAGVNIDGICGFVFEGKGELHILVEDANAAKEALSTAGFDVTQEREVIITEIEDKPGELGKLTRGIARAGANIHMVYLNTKGQLVLIADYLGKIRESL